MSKVKMEIERTGLILYVKNCEECLNFYSTLLKLPILFKNDELTSFDFFGTYLMVEKEDRAEYLNITSDVPKIFSCIRMNVNNVKHMADLLMDLDIEVDYQEHHWGKVAKFKDPDGNLIAFKDEEGFANQIKEYTNI